MLASHCIVLPDPARLALARDTRRRQHADASVFRRRRPHRVPVAPVQPRCRWQPAGGCVFRFCSLPRHMRAGRRCPSNVTTARVDIADAPARLSGNFPRAARWRPHASRSHQICHHRTRHRDHTGHGVLELRCAAARVKVEQPTVRAAHTPVVHHPRSPVDRRGHVRHPRQCPLTPCRRHRAQSRRKLRHTPHGVGEHAHRRRAIVTPRGPPAPPASPAAPSKPPRRTLRTNRRHERGVHIELRTTTTERGIELLVHHLRMPRPRCCVSTRETPCRLEKARGTRRLPHH